MILSDKYVFQKSSSFRQPPSYNQAVQQRRVQAQVHVAPATSTSSEHPQKIRVHHPFLGRNKPQNPFKKPPNLFFVSFEDPEPVEDACRLSDIGGRPYIPPRAAMYLAQRPSARLPVTQESTNNKLEEDKSEPEKVGESEENKDNKDNKDILESEESTVEKSNSPKVGCLKQKCDRNVTPPALPQQKRVAFEKRVVFDIPSCESPSEVGGETTEDADEKRRLGDGAQCSENVEESCDGLKDEDVFETDLEVLPNGKVRAVDNQVVKPKLRMRHSSMPESQQSLAQKSSRFSSLKALKRFVLSRHSKSALKKKVNESAVISLKPQKVITGGSAVQSTTTLQRSNSFRGMKQSGSGSGSPVYDVVGDTPPLQRGGRHNSEVLSSRPSLGSFIRGLPEKFRGRAVGADNYSPSADSSTNDECSPVHLGASHSSLGSSESSESKPRPMSPEECSIDLDRKRESLVSGEDGAESVESPGEADSAYQQSQTNGIVNGSSVPEQRVGLKTTVRLASLEQKFQHKLQAVERECEARATAKEVQLHAKIRELEEQLIASNW